MRRAFRHSMLIRFDGPARLASAITISQSRSKENETTPGEPEGCFVSHHSANPSKDVEAAGIEPASRNVSTAASTCVVECIYAFALATRIDTVRPRLAGHVF